MFNEICVLMTKSPLNAVSVQFADTVNAASFSGKQKKGAQTVKAGHIMCTVMVEGAEEPLQLRTPVGGKLLELNDLLALHPEMLASHHNSSGFVAVIYPNTEIPSLAAGGCADYATLMERITGKTASNKGNVCFSFQKGNCTRGNKCKFSHDSNEDV